MNDPAFLLLALLLIKHYLADFPLQRPFMYRNKGKYGHAGGIAHAMIHALGTFFVMCWLDPTLAARCALLDAMIHYHIDWAKMKLTFSQGWAVYLTGGARPDANPPPGPYLRPHLAIYSDAYFQALGIDQLLHHLTYVGLVWLAL